MAGQAKERLVVGQRDDHRLARLDRHSVNDDPRIGQPLDDLLAQIPHPHRTRTGEEHQIVFGQGLGNGGGKRLFPVTDYAVEATLGPGLADESAEERAVHVPNLARLRGLFRGDDLIPG